MIAWGGVAAQLVIAIPIVIWITLFGFTRFDALNAAMGILGYYNLAVALFNLLPIPGLDGPLAWSLIPEAVKRWRNRRQNRPAPRRFSR